MKEATPRSTATSPTAHVLACAILAVVATYGFLSCGRNRDDVPSFDAVHEAYRPSDVQLLDRNGEVLHELRTDDRRRSLAWTPLATISPLLREAIVSAEDRRFASHAGVDPLALLGALKGFFPGRAARGASTITMQLATLIDQQHGRRRAERSLGEKWRQMQRALAIERAWSKDEILEAYLNLISFRGEVAGLGAATAVFFGKRPDGISQGEALVLASLPRSPNAAAPSIVARASRLAERMSVAVDASQIAAATQDVVASDGAGPRVALAPHLARRLVREFARGAEIAARPLRTTLDLGLQRAAARLLEQQLLELRGRNVRDGAVLVVDNSSGDVLAYVGGRGGRASARYVDGVRARRQAGSTLKPFLYASVLDARLLTAASLLEDAPLSLPVVGGLYQPHNYDESFRGIVTLRSALASSLNVPAVRTLELFSTQAFLARLRQLGFAGLVRDGEFYGPSLALGSAEVSLEELVTAYRTLANGGHSTPLRRTPAVPAATSDAQGERVFSAEAAFVISDVLADRESRSATFGLDNTLATRFWSAVKTGTSKEMRDNWCVGFSSRFTVGVWVGNSSGEPMHDVSGLSGAAPVWRELMAMLHAQDPGEAPTPPPSLARVAVAFPSGIEPPREEWFLHGTEPRASKQTLAPPAPRIRSPRPDTLIAIDPDIPWAVQRIVFEAAGLARFENARWFLDERELGPGARPYLWEPSVGRHRLELVNEGRVLDHVGFVVRGAPRATSHRHQ